MSYGRTVLQEILAEGRRELSRHYYGDGRWGHSPRPIEGKKWQVVKHRPREIVWAQSTGIRARKIHAIRYQLEATHKDGHILYLTVWRCGISANAPIVPVYNPITVCASCYSSVVNIKEVMFE